MLLGERVDGLLERAHREIDAGILPSCQLALALDGQIVASLTLGDTTAGDDSRYVIYSCTKAVVASAVWQLLAEGSLRLEDKVSEHIPEFATNGKDVVTIEQVLLHTAGFPRAPLGPRRWADRDARVSAFARWRLNWEPGTRYEYHATSAHWVLAELLARLDGCDHREALRRRVLDPLGLRQLRLGVPVNEQRDVQRVRHTSEPATPEELEAVGFEGFDPGEVTDETLMHFAEPENIEVGVPGAGGVSSAADLALFYQALLHDPDGLWDADWLAIATRDVRNTYPDVMAGGVPINRTIGLVVNGADCNGVRRGFGHGNGPAAFGHMGAGGQVAWADPGTGLSFAYVTNGLDRHILRQMRRSVGLSSRAAACVGAG